jgi:predicted alpha/beta superfamily hydrolase
MKQILALFFTLVGLIGFTQETDKVPPHDKFQMFSLGLGEDRHINVWTPPSYGINSDSFPVLYMLDGGIHEDFPHLANTVSALIEAKKIQPIILVGIENTQRRRDLTGPTMVESDKKIAAVVGGSAKFKGFLEKDLIPIINNKYRTTNEKGIIGESLAGLFVTEIFLLNPEMFDFYIAFDPSLWWNDQHLVKSSKTYLSNFPKSSKKFWFASSNTKDISSNVKKFAKVLKAQKLSNLTWQFANEPKQKHDTIFRATKEKALIWTFSSKK